MGNRNPDASYTDVEQSWWLAFEKGRKELIHTAYPALIIEYDPMTKRARVQPALRRVRANPDGSRDEMPKPPILNVPVRQTAVGKHLMHQEIQEDDVVLLVFSERGLTQFKAAWGEIATPSLGAVLQERDAMAIPWGSEDIEPIRDTGWIVQNDTGECYFSVDGNDPDGPTIRAVIRTEDGEDRTRLFMNIERARLAHMDSEVEVDADMVRARKGSNTSATLQDDSLALVQGSASFNMASGVVTLNAPGGFNITASHVHHGGITIGNDHVHPYTRPQHPAGSANSGTPQ